MDEGFGLACVVASDSWEGLNVRKAMKLGNIRGRTTRWPDRMHASQPHPHHAASVIKAQRQPDPIVDQLGCRN